MTMIRQTKTEIAGLTQFGATFERKKNVCLKCHHGPFYKDKEAEPQLMSAFTFNKVLIVLIRIRIQLKKSNLKRTRGFKYPHPLF